MISPEDVKYVVPADIAEYVSRLEAEIDRQLVKSGGTYVQPIEGGTGRRVAEALAARYKEGGYDTRVEADPHNYSVGGTPYHFHVHIEKKRDV
jgi:hypothetical protein